MLFFVYYINVKELIKKIIKVYKLKLYIYNNSMKVYYEIREAIDG